MVDPLRRRCGSLRAAGYLRLLAPTLLLALTGCALVPTGGPVQSGRAVPQQDPLAQPYVRMLPSAPQADWTPEQMVAGFLATSASFQGNHEAARAYLAPEVSSQWKPESRVEVYDNTAGFDLVVERSSDGNAVVTMSAAHVATISGRGQYTALGPGKTYRAKFRLRRLGGQWQIVSFPPELLLTSGDVERAYRTANLYFFSPGYQVLVPNSIYVQGEERDHLPTRLARGVVQGPTEWLAPAVRTAFPDGAELDRAVRISDGVATVALRGTGGSDRESLAYMSAQLAWTLCQLPEVDSIRIRVGERILSVPGIGERVSEDSWASVDPAGTFDDVSGYLVRGGRLMVSTPDGLEPAPGPAGSGNQQVRSPAVSLRGNGTKAAWLSDEARELNVGQLREGGSVSVQLTGERLLSPSWDRFGNLWVVEDRGERSVVWMLDGGTEPVRVEMGGLAGREIRALRVARDGSRVAVVTGQDSTESALLVGRVERGDEGVRVGGLVPLPTGLAEVVDLAWRDAHRVAVIGKDLKGVFAPYLVHVDGTGVTPAVSRGNRMLSIAAAPDAPMMVELGTKQVWKSRDDLGWQLLGDGLDPVYPG